MRQHARKSDPPARPEQAAAARVLLLDDNPFAVERIGRALTEAGYWLAGPAGDDEAPVLAVDVVICDVKRIAAAATAIADAGGRDRPALIGLVPDHWHNSKCLPERPVITGYVAKSDVAGLLEILKAGNFRNAAA